MIFSYDFTVRKYKDGEKSETVMKRHRAVVAQPANAHFLRLPDGNLA
jgi:hypothetical protein